MKDQVGLKRICIACFIAMLISFVVHIQALVAFNQQEATVHGNNSGNPVYMDIDPRSNSTSSWLKRDYPMPGGETADLIGQTIDGTLFNNSGDKIQEWSLRINIEGDCFINQAWTGETEIHQYAGTGRERVQKLDLRDYNLDDVTLEKQYDGDMLIPLVKGDYLIYFPNEHYTEMPIPSGDKVTIGMIFYYLDELNLSDYDVTIRFRREFWQGWTFIVFITAAGLWILSAVIYGSGLYFYRNAQKQMEMRRTGLSYMSELYEAIYIINLGTGEMTPVSAGEYIEGIRAHFKKAKEVLANAVRGDAEESVLEATLDFVDTDTLADRMKDRENLVYEFVSSLHGWCRFLFFAMDRTEDGKIENVIFAVQNINEERSEMTDIREQLSRAEAISTANVNFLANASRDLQEPVRELISLDEQLMRETDVETARKRVKEIRGTAERMLLLINGLADRAEREGGTPHTGTARYSLKKLIADSFAVVRHMADKKGIRLETEVTESIPDALNGSETRMKETIVSMLANAINHSEEGSVRLSVFGRMTGETVHLLVSVRSVPDGAASSGEDGKQVRDSAVQDLDTENARNLLDRMGSGLKSVRTADRWKDIYFEIDQQAADSAPIGKITAEDTAG